MKISENDSHSAIYLSRLIWNLLLRS
jgi:hypothetical protein